MAEFGGVGFNPLVSGLGRSAVAQAQDELIEEANDLRSPAEEAQLASTDPATAAIEQVQSTEAVTSTAGTADSASTNTNAQSGQGRTVEDQVVLSSQAQQFLDRLTEQAAANDTEQTAANNNDTNSITSNPTAGAASDELTNTSRVDGNQDGQNQNGGSRERAQLIDQFA